MRASPTHGQCRLARRWRGGGHRRQTPPGARTLRDRVGQWAQHEVCASPKSAHFHQNLCWRCGFVVGKRRPEDKSLVGAQDSGSLARCVPVPYPHRAIKSGAGDMASVASERHAVDEILMIPQSGGRGAGRAPVPHEQCSLGDDRPGPGLGAIYAQSGLHREAASADCLVRHRGVVAPRRRLGSNGLRRRRGAARSSPPGCSPSPGSALALGRFHLTNRRPVVH